MSRKHTALAPHALTVFVSRYIHIRIQQRNGRKSLTTCQGLANDLDVKRILKAIKKVQMIRQSSHPESDLRVAVIQL